jgi:hypothetical protein
MSSGISGSNSHLNYFLKSCLEVTAHSFTSIAYTGLKCFKFDVHRFIGQLNSFAESSGYDYRFESRNAYIIGSVQAIASVLVKSTPYSVKSLTSIDPATAVYSAITMVDAWIDGGKRGVGYKKSYIRLVQDLMLTGVTSPSRDESIKLLDSHTILILFAHQKLAHRPGWVTFVRDFDRLVKAGDREFTSTTPSTCLRATELVGAYSAAAIFNAIFIDQPSNLKRSIKLDVMRLGAIMNIIDDIFDYSDDIKAARKTFVTQSDTIERGQELGYAKCARLWAQLKANKSRHQQLPMQNTMAVWWLRNRFNSGDLSTKDFAKILLKT